MKKIIGVIFIICMMMIMVSCGNNKEEVMLEEVGTLEEETENIESDDSIQNNDEPEETDGIDIDLTTLSSTMVYAEVYEMYMYPDEYTGQIVKMEGAFNIYEEPNTGVIYFSVIIEDALGCCAQGIEFELAGDYTYPDDYPENGTEVTVVGEFDLYEEYGTLYCRLREAEFV